MSKLVKGHIDVADLQAVEDAAHMIGWSVERNARVRYYNGPATLCDMVLEFGTDEETQYGTRIHKYNIGFKCAEDGTIAVLHDNAMEGGAVYSAESHKLDATTARVVGAFKQAYNEVMVRRAAHQQKKQVQRVVRADGAVVLLLKGYH